MVRKRTNILLVVVLLCSVSCSIPVAGPHGRVKGIPGANLFSDAHWGLLVRSLNDGRVIWAKDEKLHFIPASNLKLFTTAVSLLRLGPDYRYTTRLLGHGKIENGVLHGDLVVRASGDPSLSPRFHEGGAVAVFEEWADTLAKRGIKKIQGDVVIDNTLFDTQYMGTGWFWDDEIFPYSAQISAFSINDNCIELRVAANAEEGEPGIVKIKPETSYVTIVNRTRTIDATESSITITRQAGSNRVIVSGTVSPRDCPKRFDVAVHEPAFYGATVLKEVLESRGITVQGRGRVVDDDQVDPKQDEDLLVSLPSPPLSVILSRVNKSSHNLSAELLFRTLGAVYYGKGTARNGSRVILETLERAGIIPDEISIRDGSGLSRLSMVTPEQVVNLLEYMYHQPTFAQFYNSLPIAGADGTLATRMVGTCAANNVRAKTGFSTHIGSLSGYLRNLNGEMLAFSMLTNNNPQPPFQIKKLQDSFCGWLCGEE